MAVAGAEDTEETESTENHSIKPKICILGGGVAGLTTAWALTRCKEGEELPYEVHLYQMGWRMGGKGRTGRQPERQHRVIEHGLHALGGYYHNTFRMLRTLMSDKEVKANFKPTSRVAFPVEITPSRRDPKTKKVGIIAYDWPSPDGSAHNPAALPGERGRGAPNVATLIGRLARYLEGLDLVDMPGRKTPAASSEFALRPLESPPPPELRDTIERRSGAKGWRFEPPEGWNEKDAAGWDRPSKEQLRGLLVRASRLGETYGNEGASADAKSWNDASMRWLAAQSLELLEARPDRHSPEQAAWLRSGLSSASRAERQALWRNVTRLCLAIVVGVISSDAITKGLEVLDCTEFRDFLRINGASEHTVRSGVVKGIYDYAFAYEDGDPDKPSLAAGVAVRFILLFFLDAVGGLQFHMARGMGESFILPIYQALEGTVHFHPYYEARSLSLSADGRRIAKVTLHPQLESKGKNLPRSGSILLPYPKGKYWPDVPAELKASSNQAGSAEDAAWNLEAPAIEPSDLEEHDDFDHVVLAIPPAAHEALLPEALRDGWKVLFEPKHNVATISAQVWCDNPHAPSPFILVGRDARIFQSVADMRHLLEHEVDPHSSRLYFLVGPCTRLETLPTRQVSDEMAFDAAEAYFRGENDDLEVLGLTWKPPGSSGPSDHVQRNDRPSDLYVRSGPHTISKRPGTRVRGVDNLFLAGDWVRTGLDFGCVEAAVIAGIRAANAIRERFGLGPEPVYEAGGPVRKTGVGK